MNFAERGDSGKNPLSRLRGEGCFRDEPLPSFRFAKCQFPFLSPGGDIFPRPGEVFPLRWRPWQRGQVSSSFVNGIRSQPISGKLYAPAKASPFRERWHGKAVTERVVSGKNPLSRLRRQLVPLFVAWRRHLPPAGGSLSTQVEALAKRVSFVLTRQRQKKPAVKL